MELLQNSGTASSTSRPSSSSRTGAALIALLPVFMRVLVVLFFVRLAWCVRDGSGRAARPPGRIERRSRRRPPHARPDLRPDLRRDRDVPPVPRTRLRRAAGSSSGSSPSSSPCSSGAARRSRDYDHVADLHPTVVPAVVHQGPPPGVHMPGPSFRPFLASLGVGVPVPRARLPGLDPAVRGRLHDRPAARLAATTRARSTARRSRPTRPATSRTTRRRRWPKRLFWVVRPRCWSSRSLFTAGWFPPKSASGETAAARRLRAARRPRPARRARAARRRAGSRSSAQDVKFNVAKTRRAGGQAVQDHVRQQGRRHHPRRRHPRLDRGEGVRRQGLPRRRDRRPTTCPALKAGTYKFECSIHPDADERRARRRSLTWRRRPTRSAGRHPAGRSPSPSSWPSSRRSRSSSSSG